MIKPRWGKLRLVLVLPCWLSFWLVVGARRR